MYTRQIVEFALRIKRKLLLFYHILSSLTFHTNNDVRPDDTVYLLQAISDSMELRDIMCGEDAAAMRSSLDIRYPVYMLKVMLYNMRWNGMEWNGM